MSRPFPMWEILTSVHFVNRSNFPQIFVHLRLSLFQLSFMGSVSVWKPLKTLYSAVHYVRIILGRLFTLRHRKRNEFEIAECECRLNGFGGFAE